jgi:ADP-heptose:LPS heptosyltransferase
VRCSWRRDWRAIRREKYDICIDPVCTYGWYPAFLCLSSGAPARIGFAGGGTHVFFTRSLDDALFPRIHMTSLTLELLRLLGIRPGGSIPRIAVPKAAGAGARVAVHPGGRYPSQEWGDDRFRDLAVRIRDGFPVRVAFIGAPSERKRLEKLAESCGAGTGVFCGEIAELVPFLAGSALFIGNNSGPLHLAAALSVPTVSFMGPTDPQRFMPVGDARNSVLRNAELVCSPCGKGRCLRHRCLRSISVEQAFDTVQSYLKAVI